MKKFFLTSITKSIIIIIILMMPLNSIAVADNYYLEINYQANGETFDVYVYNGATWDDMGDLSSGSMTALQIQLNSNHRLGSGDVRVGFAGQSETGDNSQSTLYIEYHRIRSLQQVMNSTADVTLTGTVNSNFGWSVAYAGDIDNDNYDDVIVGAPGYSSNKGAAYIYKGGSSMDSAVDVTFIGAENGDNFGYSVAYAGDINSDSYSDVIIGAPFSDGSGGTKSDSGAVYIFLGSTLLTGILEANSANYIGYGENAGDRLGWSVDRTEDINKDGKKNMVVGSPNFGDNNGKAYIMCKIPEFPIILLPIFFICILYVANRKLKNSKKSKNR